MKTQHELINSLFPQEHEGLMKALALKQHEGEDYFLIEEGEDIKAFEGTIEEATNQYNGVESLFHSFNDFVTSELIEVDPIDNDEERDNYIVLTDDEADGKAKQYILESVWAFNPSFLAGESGIDQEVFEAIQANNRCEDNNEAILRLIEDEDSFVESAISADGRGHFMSSYDGGENEETVNEVTFYIYRIN